MTSIRHLPGAPRYLRVNANDETNLLTLNDDSGAAPLLQFREQGAERHRVTHNPLVGTEGSYQLVSATGRVDVSIDHATGAASSFAAIPTVLVVPVTTSAELATALTQYNGMVTPITISMAAGTYDGTTMMATDYNYSDITFLGPDVGHGFTAHGIGGDTIVTAGNDLTPTPDFANPPAIGGTLRYFDVTTQAYTDFTITNIVAGVYTLSAPPPAAPNTGDVVFVLPSVTINNWPAGLLDLNRLWYSTRSTVVFENIVLDSAQISSVNVPTPTFSEVSLRGCVHIGSVRMDPKGFLTELNSVFQRLASIQVGNASFQACALLTDVAGNATDVGNGLVRSTIVATFTLGCVIDSVLRCLNCAQGTMSFTFSFLFYPAATAATSAFFSRSGIVKFDTCTLTTTTDSTLALCESGTTVVSQNTTWNGIAAAGTRAVVEGTYGALIALFSSTITGGGYSESVANTAICTNNTTTLAAPAAAINPYIVDAVGSAGPLPLIGATNATIS